MIRYLPSRRLHTYAILSVIATTITEKKPSLRKKYWRIYNTDSKHGLVLQIKPSFRNS
jgi:hypothetical protein